MSKRYFHLIFFLKKTKIILLCTTSNLRKHFKDSKPAVHQAEWKRILEEETKSDKTKNKSTPMKIRLLADYRKFVIEKIIENDYD